MCCHMEKYVLPHGEMAIIPQNTKLQLHTSNITQWYLSNTRTLDWQKTKSHQPQHPA